MLCLTCRSYYAFIKKSKGKKTYCRKCGTAKKFVPPNYEHYHETRYSYERVRTVHNDPLLKKICDLLRFQKNDTVLDFGCGAGDYVSQVSLMSKKTKGVDRDVTTAKKRFPKNSFLTQKAEKLPFPDNSFDKIMAINVIEHVYDFDGLLKELKRVLKPQGKLFITTYDTRFILHFLHNDPTHVIEWTKEEFETLISKYFTIEHSFRYGTFFNYFPFNKWIVQFLKPELCIVGRK
ncbi:class I SAM-dependent methyltransferase [Candidatus Roizmanbacteria bacterium]|nr:class I SAM-dependent methyltransferase [Candidatus Roizmanbacteria bacterium]